MRWEELRIPLRATVGVPVIVPQLGQEKHGTNEKACRLLGWAPRSNEEAIIATAESLLRLGLLKESQPRAA